MWPMRRRTKGPFCRFEARNEVATIASKVTNMLDNGAIAELLTQEAEQADGHWRFALKWAVNFSFFVVTGGN